MADESSRSEAFEDGLAIRKGSRADCGEAVQDPASAPFGNGQPSARGEGLEPPVVLRDPHHARQCSRSPEQIKVPARRRAERHHAPSWELCLHSFSAAASLDTFHTIKPACRRSRRSSARGRKGVGMER
jgi:hypothetical protein